MAVLITVDAKQAACQITLRITHVGEVRWRLWLSSLLIRLASFFSPLKVVMSKDISEPILVACPFCEREVAERCVPERWEYPQCKYCGRCFPVLGGAVMPLEYDDCECGIVEPYGFVVEAGCPTHD